MLLSSQPCQILVGMNLAKRLLLLYAAKLDGYLQNNYCPKILLILILLYEMLYIPHAIIIKSY